MADLNVRVLKLHLKHLSQEELINEIGTLFEKFGPVKDYYRAKLSTEDGRDVLERYKGVIRHEFFPTRGLGQARLSVAKKAVTDYKKITNSQEDLADLMLFYVETGVEFTLAYGSIDEPFYNSMEGMYEKAAQHIVRHGLQDRFEPRCSKIVDDTRDIGWGFPDALGEIYDEHFPAQDAFE